MDTKTILLAGAECNDLEHVLIATERLEFDFHVRVLGNEEKIVHYFAGMDERQKRCLIGPCDLLFLSLVFPKLDGLRVLRQLQWLYRENLAQLPPIVILSATSEPRIVAAAYQYGANGFLSKSVGASQFVRVIQETLHYWLSATLRPCLTRPSFSDFSRSFHQSKQTSAASRLNTGVGAPL